MAEEFVEAVDRRQVLVQIAEMVLAELSGGVAERLQHGSQRACLVRTTDIGAGLAHRGQSGAQWQLAGNKISAAGGAARLGVIIGEAHAVGGELVEVRRLARHDALMVGADVEPADIVAHDDENVRLSAGWRGLLRLGDGLLNTGSRAQRRSRSKRRRSKQDVAAVDSLSFSIRLLSIFAAGH